MNQTKNIYAGVLVTFWIISAVVLIFLSINLVGVDGAVLPIIAYLLITVLVADKGGT